MAASRGIKGFESRSDFRLAVRAIMQGWQVEDVRRRELVGLLYEIAKDREASPRDRVSAVKACMAADVLASQFSSNVIEAEFERIEERDIDSARIELGERLARLADAGVDIEAFVASETGRE